MPQHPLPEAARLFAKSKLWERYPAGALFAVRYADGDTGYACVTGGPDAPAALMLYAGEQALPAYYMLRTLPAQSPRFRVHETMARQDCALCTLQGDTAVFRRRRPYRPPVPLTEAQDEAHLYDALQAAGALALHLDALMADLPPEGALCAAGLNPAAHTVPLLTVQANAERPFLFSTLAVPEDLPFTVDSPLLDEEAAAMLRSIPQNGTQTLLCELVISPRTVGGDQPAYPVGLLMLDPEEGIVGMPVVHDYAAAHDELVAALLSFCMEHGKPALIRIQDDLTYLLLQNTAAQIGLPLEKTASLAQIDAVKADFFDSIPGD